MTYNTELALSIGERVSLKLTAPPPPLAGSVVLDCQTCFMRPEGVLFLT